LLTFQVPSLEVVCKLTEYPTPGKLAEKFQPIGRLLKRENANTPADSQEIFAGEDSSGSFPMEFSSIVRDFAEPVQATFSTGYNVFESNFAVPSLPGNYSVGISPVGCGAAVLLGCMVACINQALTAARKARKLHMLAQDDQEMQKVELVSNINY